jgi:hypothetical protein
VTRRRCRALPRTRSRRRTWPRSRRRSTSTALRAQAERGLPRLSELSDQRQKWEDNEEDATSDLVEPVEVGHRYGRRWAGRATPEQLEALLGQRPQLPRHLDGELLKFANTQGIDTWDDEAAKYAVRAAAWVAVEELAAERHGQLTALD